MKRLYLAASTTMLVVFVPAVAQAKQPTAQHVQEYKVTYHQVASKLGTRAPGRNIVRWGIRPNHPASDDQVITSLAVLHRMLAPPPAPTATSVPTASVSSVSTSTASASSSALPSCTWVPESGGDWHAVNSSSGAGGRYQILPSTWAANGGTGSPQDASPAEQTRVALNVLHSQGLGAWVNC